MAPINNASLETTGEHIGMDYCFYGLEPKTNNQFIKRGFDGSKSLKNHKKRSSRTIRKWLNLRLHAYERGIHFSENVTTSFIDELMSQTNGRCPYTGVKLTKGQLQGSDWSIDRICNDYGYIPINIVVMARDINEAKSNMSFEEIYSHVTSGIEYKGFQKRVWQKVLNDMAIAESILGDPLNVQAGIEENLSSGDTLLRFFLQNIVNTDNLDERKMHAAGLINLPGISATKRTRIEKLIRSIVIKSGNTASREISEILNRSAKLNREVKALGNILPMQQINSLYYLNRTIMLKNSNEAKKAERIY